MGDIKALLNLLDKLTYRYGSVTLNGAGNTNLHFSQGHNGRNSWVEINEDSQGVITVKGAEQDSKGIYGPQWSKTLSPGYSLYAYLKSRLTDVEPDTTKIQVVQKDGFSVGGAG